MLSYGRRMPVHCFRDIVVLVKRVCGRKAADVLARIYRALGAKGYEVQNLKKI